MGIQNPSTSLMCIICWVWTDRYTCVIIIVVVQSLSYVWIFAAPWTTACQASLSIINSPSLLKLMSIELVMPSSHVILCGPLLFPPSIFPSIRVFSNESVLCIRWPKYWSFSFSISPSKEHPGLIFRMDWLDLLAVQWSLTNLFQHHSSKASILWHSAFFTVQLSHPYMTTGKTIALTRQTFIGKVMSLHLCGRWLKILNISALGDGYESCIKAGDGFMSHWYTSGSWNCGYRWAHLGGVDKKWRWHSPYGNP